MMERRRLGSGGGRRRLSEISRVKGLSCIDAFLYKGEHWNK